MIPQGYIQEWRAVAPWQSLEMVEQDLLLSRALVDLFSNEFLSEALAFRGGTALHKLYLAPPRRYSEDIDLVQVQAGPIGPIYDAVQAALNSWLGKPSRKRGPGVANLIHRVDSEYPPSVRLRLKIEINTREHFTVHGLAHREFGVSSRWYTGHCRLTTYSLEELLGTKMRALFQRRKGRDLFDLWLGLTDGGADPDRIVAAFHRYMQAEGAHVSRQEFLDNLAAKREHPGFLSDIEPLVVEGVGFDPPTASAVVEKELVMRLG